MALTKILLTTDGSEGRRAPRGWRSSSREHSAPSCTPLTSSLCPIPRPARGRGSQSGRHSLDS
jgi:hypothetical protein